MTLRAKEDWMLRFVSRATSALIVLLLLPAAAYAQAAITGVARDASGGVLPGVTVEAASPVLIEKVRSVVTDGTGQYRIVNLLAGTYTVTFSLPGFSTVKRDGIELTGTFVATVNGDMKVGALEETITVTGETPIVDVQSAKVQQTVSKDVLTAIPSSRNAGGIQALVPGMSSTTDSGGITGTMTGGAGSIHGGRGNDSRTYSDGNNTGWAGGSAGGGNTPNVAGAQEVVLSTSGGLGEAETAGVILNVIPRDGGNTFSGQFNASGANGSMQGSNFTQSLQNQGLKTPSQLLKVYDINPMGGGRIIRDKLWFYLTYRQTGGQRTVPGMWINTNAGNPNVWAVNFDKSQPAFDDSLERNGIARITWQMTPRNKIAAHWSEQYTASSIKGGGTGTVTPEASTYTLFQPSEIASATWSSPVSGRLLLEAGWGMYQSRYRNPGPRVDGTFNPLMIRETIQDGEIPGLSARASAGVGGGYNHHLIGALANLRASASYVTGAHNLKFGYQGGFGNPSQTYTYFNEVILVRVNGGLANRITQVVSNANTNLKIVRNLIPTSFYGQDQWTVSRLTLQGGVRYDHLLTTYPDSSFGGPGYAASAPIAVDYPSRSTQGVDWNDVSVRTGAAYDLFGNGKTALKFNLGKYMEAFSATNTDLDLNPLIRNTVSTTRTWTGTGFNFLTDPNCNLALKTAQKDCGAMDNQNFGTANFTRSYDPNFVTGFGKRPYNWGLGVSLQQEILPRVSVNVGYFRNWWGNWYVVNNTATSVSDYTPFSIVAPTDPRLPGGGGQTIPGLYNLIPTKVGAVNELATASSNFAKQIENWQGVDFNVVARLRSGLTVQGGTSTGRRLVDDCAVRTVLPELGAGVSGGSNNSIPANIDPTINSSVTNPYCRVVEPYLTQFRGLASYLVPKVGLQVSTTWSTIPGPIQQANYTVTNAVANASSQPLGRNLSSGNVTVNLIQPGTLYGPRINNIDFRVAKVLRYGRTRTQIGVDVYNLTNTDVVTTYNNAYTSTSWLVPQTIQPARYVKISAQFDF
jgi:hypothetical protein